MSKKQSAFTPVEPRPDYGLLTDKIIQFWKDNQIFEKSVDQRPEDNLYVFYDGPPFVTGLPHYGHLLSGIAKDLVPRYWTMKGKRVERVWGWDCHGLPIEEKVERKLQLNSRRDIEKIGLEKFIGECFNYVSEISSEWDWYVDHSGRWVDMERAYKTMDRDYMESVWWVFKQIYDKDLVYKGKRVSLYCPRCGTPISNFEVAMDNSYKEITEVSNVYKYKLEEKQDSPFKSGLKDTYILAWSTTPWNKLATPALAVNPDLTYVKIKQGNEHYVLAETTLSILTDDSYTIIDRVKGKKLDGVTFEPHYDFYDIPKDKKAWVILAGDFVTAEEGTGVVTLAVYGEDDFKIMQERNVVLIEHVDEEGHLTIKKKPWNGIYYLKANKMVNSDLAERGLMYREDSITHSVAECWRCQTRLMYSPQDAWFISIDKLKDQLLKTNEDIYWFPNHLKEGRFKKGIETAPDWCISRSRYWATPMPVWQAEDDPSHRVVIGSIEELEKRSGKKVKDLHRPYIDEFTFEDEGHKMVRIPDVLDSWMDAGSMPYAQVHYPFENKKKFEDNFPADYIIEYVAQTRAWFYVMHVIGNALFDKPSFKNVICTGVIQGTDGRKMSKSFGNYPDPKRVLNEQGGDAFRLYLMSSPIMAAENLNINEDEIKEQNQRVLSILWNSYKYFVTYANLHEFKPTSVSLNTTSKNVLDQWVLTRLKELTLETSRYIEAYNIPKATRQLRPFITDVSTWYIRRSRDRFVSGDPEALQTLYTVLYYLSLVMAPTTPFMAEEIYQELKLEKDPESVHLCLWPEVTALTADDKNLLKDMDLVRVVATEGNAERKRVQIPLRQPLAKVQVQAAQKKLNKPLLQIITEELNVKGISWKSGDSVRVKLDTKLTKDLKEEGEARNLIREIQNARRKAGVSRSTEVIVTLLSWPVAWEKEIKKKTLVKEIRKGDTIEVIS